MAPTSRVQSVDRTLDVLEALGSMGGAARSIDIAEQLSLPAPTVHRILATLSARGYVGQLPDKRYSLGAALIRLGAQAAAQVGYDLQPILDELAGKLGETVNLAFMQGTTMTYVAQAASRRSMRMFTEVGARVPMHSSGVGKATLAHLPSGEVDAILASTSSIDAPALQAELELSRERGFALDDEEQEIGVRCLAVHVPGAPVPAALSTSSPTSRLTEDVYDSFAKELHAAAAKLTAVWEARP
ncbi:IclR family transcriptional regulator [Brevibacterium ravenspurgense]|uniref:IclR family transcriptional regulator n=1 Tax=Brevibacterium ravenspurgense TaxID=479117 RepID=UPI000782E88A|nr:IclR family transcriptional regulator [Brevibacterium ravenspurgense]